MPLEEVTVRNYYGPGKFAEIEADSEDTTDTSTQPPVASSNSGGTSFIDINFEGLMYDQYSVWKIDSVNPLTSYGSKYDASAKTSSQTCTAFRSIQDRTNFILTPGKQFNFV